MTPRSLLLSCALPFALPFAFPFALPGAALAASPVVGQDAPDFGSAQWVLNQPLKTSVTALRGEVVFIEHWGVKCPPCRALIPHVEQLQEEYGAKGLHIFAFEHQGHTPDQIQAALEESGGKTYPVSAGGCEGYKGDGTLPVAWLIGVEGKVIWQGNPAADRGKIDTLIAAEIAKVRTPGLRPDLDPSLGKAIKAFMKQELGAARAEAREVAADAGSSDKAKADAEYVAAEVDGLAQRQWALLEAQQAEKRYLEAFETLTWFTQTFKKSEDGEKAEGLLKELKKDKAVKKELDAAKKLKALLAKLEGQAPEFRAMQLKKLASKLEGTAAGAEAERLAMAAAAATSSKSRR